MPVAAQARPFDPRPRRRTPQWPLGFAVLVASILNAVVWAGLLAVARAFLHP
jgi:hypothetical protein